MLAWIRAHWEWLSDETAQDLAEYCLLTALVSLLALGIFVQASGGVRGIWSSAGGSMATAGASNTTGNATASTPGGN